MDLRTQKTTQLIKHVFLELRQRLPVEKIKVKTICDKALINRSTFYHHYLDVYDLSD